MEVKKRSNEKKVNKLTN